MIRPAFSILVFVALLFSTDAPMPTDAWIEALVATEIPAGHNAHLAAQCAVDKLNGPAALKTAAYALRDARRRFDCPSDDHRSFDVTSAALHMYAEEAIRYKLAEIPTDEAARTLVELFADESFEFDGETAEALDDAVCLCGRRASPYLATITSGESAAWARRVEEMIRNGERGF